MSVLYCVLLYLDLFVHFCIPCAWHTVDTQILIEKVKAIYNRQDISPIVIFSLFSLVLKATHSKRGRVCGEKNSKFWKENLDKSLCSATCWVGDNFWIPQSLLRHSYIQTVTCTVCITIQSFAFAVLCLENTYWTYLVLRCIDFFM